MSMDICIEAIKPADGKFKEMKTIYDACDKAGVRIPPEVDKFFNGEEPHDDGVRVSAGCATTGDPMYSNDGALIDLTKLPDGVKYIRVWCSC